MSGKLKSSAALAILVAIATVSAPSTAYYLRPVIAQVTDTPTFPAPAEVPSGTEVRINGSRTMEQINTTLAERFESQFSGTTVDVSYDGTDTALQAVLNGEADLAAIGRSLTEQERAQGLVEVAVARHKIAVITAANSPFNGSLTVDQFAQIFRGEVTDWSQVGGAPGAIRLVDRPEESETRQAFQRYPSFQTAPFTTGANAEQVGEDSTQAVLANLGTNGVGYAIADQVAGNAGVRIVPMHDVLPDDPRYPFSQPLNYVYREAANPAVQAFLGYATAPDTQPAVEEARSADAVAVLPFVAPAPAPEAPSPEAEAPPPAEPAPEAEVPAATDPNATDPGTTDPNAEPTPATTTDPEAATATRRTTFPWWLLLLFPILGGLLWWLLRDDRGAATGAVATGTVPPPVGVFPGTEGSRIILTPHTCKDAYAYWEVPDEVFDRLQDEGGRDLVLRLYDVTDLDLNRQDPHSVKEFTCDPAASDRHVPIAVDDRDYIVELGYVTSEGDWLRIARSDYVRVPACDSDIWNEVPARDTFVQESAATSTPLPSTAINQPTAQQTGGTLGQVALGATGIAAAGAASQAVTRPPVSPPQESRVILVPRSANDAYAYWELSEERKAALRKLGGRKLSLRVYDVTDIDMTTQPVHSVRQYDCDEQTADLHLPIYEADRDYIAELGYVADDGRWLRVARSETVRFPSSLDATRTVQTPETPVREVTARADVDRSGTVNSGTINPGTINPGTINPPKGSGTTAGIVGAAGAATGTAARMVSDSATRAIPDRDRTDRPMVHDRGIGSQPTDSPSVSGMTDSRDTASRVTASGVAATPARSPVEVVRRIILVPRTPESAYAYWEVSDSAKAEAKRQGGTQFMLRVHDATGIDIDHQLPHSTQEYPCAEEEQDKHISIPASDRDYIAEIGYYTDDNRWLRIIRSFHVSVPSDPALF